MVRNYKRKTARSSYSQTSLQQAVELVRDKKASLREAEKATGVPFNSIRRHIANDSGLNGEQIHGYKQPRRVFSTVMEQELCRYLITCSQMNHGLTIKETCNLAYSYAISNNIIPPNSWHSEESAGKDWLEGLMKRNPQLSIRKPEATSLARCTAFNKHIWNVFFVAITPLTSFNEWGYVVHSLSHDVELNFTIKVILSTNLDHIMAYFDQRTNLPHARTNMPRCGACWYIFA